MAIKFLKFMVRSADGYSARVWYSRAVLKNGVDTITLYAKDVCNDLDKIFAGSGYQNDSDGREDYFENGRVRITKESPYWAPALERCN